MLSLFRLGQARVTLVRLWIGFVCYDPFRGVDFDDPTSTIIIQRNSRIVFFIEPFRFSFNCIIQPHNITIRSFSGAISHSIYSQYAAYHANNHYFSIFGVWPQPISISSGSSSSTFDTTTISFVSLSIKIGKRSFDDNDTLHDGALNNKINCFLGYSSFLDFSPKE